MRPPQTPIPPWGSKSRWYMTPTPLSPSFSRHRFQGAAAAASEQPCVTLFEWWLERVEGDDQKVAVAGKFERNQTVYEFGSATIAKRHEARVLETEGGILLLIYGTHNRSRMLAGGYSSEVYEKFKIGFPYCWEDCIQLYPKVAQTGSDSAINENAAVSNDGGERHEAARNEAYNVETDLIACRALRERDDGGIDTNASLVHIVECANDASNEEADNATPTSTCDQGIAQHVALSKKAEVNENVPTFVCLDVQNSSDLPNGTSRFQECTCDGDIATNENAAASNDDGEKDEDVYNDVNNVVINLTASRALSESDDGDVDINASLVLNWECANDASNEEADNPPSRSKKRDPVVPLNTQGCEKTQHTALSKKAAVDEEMLTSVCLDVQNSYDLSNGTPTFEKNTCFGDIPTNEDAAALNGNSERCTAVSKEVNSVETGLTVGSTIRESDHDGIATNVSSAPTVECTNDAINEGVDNTSLLGCKKTPVASSKSQGCQEKHQHTPSNDKPSGPPKKQRSALEKLQGATRSPFTSPVPYARESPLTRGRATSLSMSTPEDLKLRKTRSGRVVVPTLDAGCQRIVYDMDGTITGVIGLDSPLPKGSKLKTARRKREAEPPSKLKTYARKKRRAQ